MDVVSKVKWRIKELMIQKEMSIYEVASKAEITDACIRNWYTKRNYTPSLDAIIKVCNALEVPITEVFREEGDELICVGEQEKALLSNWAILSDKQREAINTLIETFLDK